jgi:hypothetical protein
MTNVYYSQPTSTGRYATWYLLLEAKKDLTHSVEQIESIATNVLEFDDYKVFEERETITGDPDSLNAYRKTTYHLVGRFEVRKRISTMMSKYNKYDGEREEYNLAIFRANKSFEFMNFDFELVASSGTNPEYSGDDIRFLDNEVDRYEWQNQLLDLFYSEKTEEMKSSDDRSIIWVYDKKGNTGKSKFVKWLCINRPQEKDKKILVF